MRRRTFIAALPAAPLAATAIPVLAQGSAPPAPRWQPGQDRYQRPDVGPGDRPVGASFASRTAVGLNDAARRARRFASSIRPSPS